MKWKKNDKIIIERKCVLCIKNVYFYVFLIDTCETKALINLFFFSFQFLVAELNTFYLKFVLWLPPEHYLNLTRLAFFLFMGAAAMRETFQYLDDP